MGLERLTERQVQGMIYLAMEQDQGLPWVDALSMFMPSDQITEEYRWLGQVPTLRQMLGGRDAQKLRDQGFTLRNLEYEATLAINDRDMTLDKTGQVQLRINEFAAAARAHDASLISALIIAAAASVGYDGEYFFDDDHSEGDSGSQSNDITVDISGLAVGGTGSHGVVAAPSVGEMAGSIAKGIAQICGQVGDNGEPVNENASEFLVMSPISLLNVAQAAVSNPVMSEGMSNTLAAADWKVRVVPNVRLDKASWTDAFCVFRTDSQSKPFIRQARMFGSSPYEYDYIGPGSDHFFKNREHLFGLYAEKNAGYALWQYACLVTMI